MSRDLLSAALLPEQRWAQDHRSDPGWSYRPRYPNPEVSPGFLLLGLHPLPQFTEERKPHTVGGGEGARTPQGLLKIGEKAQAVERELRAGRWVEAVMEG